MQHDLGRKLYHSMIDVPGQSGESELAMNISPTGPTDSDVGVLRNQRGRVGQHRWTVRIDDCPGCIGHSRMRAVRDDQTAESFAVCG
ncbi:hypothetical protein, partial [Mycolicibacterium agri]|uniref:hypothetical protein n=1 Tax=Mycolicibacterium agri TaxID=36811 RepID=UPI001A9C4FBE